MALTWREEQLIAEQTIVYFKQDLKGALTASSWQLLQSLVVSLPERMPKWQAFPQLCEFLILHIVLYTASNGIFIDCQKGIKSSHY